MIVFTWDVEFRVTWRIDYVQKGALAEERPDYSTHIDVPVDLRV